MGQPSQSPNGSERQLQSLQMRLRLTLQQQTQGQ
jgi:hypothetical protein